MKAAKKTATRKTETHERAPRTALPLVRVPFHSEEVLALFVNGEVWVLLKPMCERFGVDVEGQRQKLKKHRWTCTEIFSVQIPGDDQARDVACLSLKSLPGWLFSIHAGKVRPEVREALERYQQEAADVLYRHFLARVAPAAPEAPSPEPAPLPSPAPAAFIPSGGVIGRQRAAVYVLGPLRECARLTDQLLGDEPDHARAKKQLARAHKQVNDELRMRLGYPMVAALRWEMLTEEGLGLASQHLWHMHARLSGQVRWRNDGLKLRAQPSLFGPETSSGEAGQRQSGPGLAKVVTMKPGAKR